MEGVSVSMETAGDSARDKVGGASLRESVLVRAFTLGTAQNKQTNVRWALIRKLAMVGFK